MTLSDQRPKTIISFETTASEHAVRDILESLRTQLEICGIDPDLCGSINIALAEALNNVVEHAYAGQEPGLLWLDLEQSNDEIRISLRDKGHGLPNGRVPSAQLPDATGPLESLPEGGFGWYLIHDLTNSLTYRRHAGENTLELIFSHNQKANPS